MNGSSKPTNESASIRSSNDDLFETHTLFEQPWWLDAVAPNVWGAVEISRGNSIVARLPYVVEKRWGLTGLTMPALTQTLGPWLTPSQGKRVKELSRQKELMTSLIEQLPPCDYFHQLFHYSITNWLPFYWQGFDQTTRYTYVIESLDDLDRVWAQLHERVRRNIRKAEKQLAVHTDPDIQRFLDINALSFERQGLALPYSRDTVRRLDAACAKRQARRLFFAEDAQGRIHAAKYIVWDLNSGYYLMGGADPKLRSSGADALLMWEAIRYCATVTRKFDFEGSMIEPIERFFRAFGGVQKSYFRVVRYGRRARCLLAGRDMARALFDRTS
jgi:hypothetical protein